MFSAEVVSQSGQTISVANLVNLLIVTKDCRPTMVGATSLRQRVHTGKQEELQSHIICKALANVLVRIELHLFASSDRNSGHLAL